MGKKCNNMPRKKARKTACKKMKRLKAEAAEKGKGKGKRPQEKMETMVEENIFVKEARTNAVKLKKASDNVAKEASAVEEQIQEQTAAKIKPSMTVYIGGLKLAPQLNGLSATCISWSSVRKRWMVRMEDGESKYLKSANLRITKDDKVVVVKPKAPEVISAGRQVVQTCLEDEKQAKLLQIVKNIRLDESSGKRPESLMLIFCNTAEAMQPVVSSLNQAQLKCAPLNSEAKEAKRERAMNEFQLSGKRILVVAGDAADKLQRNELHLIVNYDFPANLDLYCSRSEQLADNGKGGIYYTLFTPSAAGDAAGLIEILERAKAPVDRSLRELVRGIKRDRSA